VEVLVQNNRRVKARFALANTALANDAATLVEFGALRISHGFIPSEWEERRDKKSDEFLGFHITKYDMIEVSLVSVPSNTDAIITAFSREKLFHPTMKSWAKSLHDARIVSVKGFDVDAEGHVITDIIMQDPGTEPDVPVDTDKATDDTYKSIPYKDFGNADTDNEWDEGAERKEMDIEDLKKYTAVVVKKNDETKGGYKLLHHEANGKANFRANVAVIAILNGGRGGLKPEPSQSVRQAIWNHAAKHIRDMDKEPPELKRRAPTQKMRRWNRTLSKHFEVTSEFLEPSKLEYDWCARFIGCEVKDLFRTSFVIASARMGTWLTGLRHWLHDWTITDTRNITEQGNEAPPHYEVIQLNSKLNDDFLVHGIMFCRRGKERLCIRIAPSWKGIRIIVYTSHDEKALNRKMIYDVHQWSKENNFLKGEAFSLCGEFLPRGDTGWADVFLSDKNMKPIKRAVDKLNAKGSKAPNRGMIFMGPPGTGKTLSGRIMLNEANTTFIWVSARDFYYMGAFGGFMEAFSMARELAPSLLFVEDVDNWMNSHTVDLLKTEMDGITQHAGVTTILTTNYPELLPEALIDRPGRFHDVLKFDLPDKAIRSKMLTKWIAEVGEQARAQAVTETEGYSGAHLYELANLARMLVEDGDVAWDKALTEALSKIKEQRDLIDAAQLEGSNYKHADDIIQKSAIRDPLANNIPAADANQLLSEAGMYVDEARKCKDEDERTEFLLQADRLITEARKLLGKSGRALSKANEQRVTDALKDVEAIIATDNVPRAALALARQAKGALTTVLSSVSNEDNEEGKASTGIGDVLAYLARATRDDIGKAINVTQGRRTILEREAVADLLNL